MEVVGEDGCEGGGGSIPTSPIPKPQFPTQHSNLQSYPSTYSTPNHIPLPVRFCPLLSGFVRLVSGVCWAFVRRVCGFGGGLDGMMLQTPPNPPHPMINAQPKIPLPTPCQSSSRSQHQATTRVKSSPIRSKAKKEQPPQKARAPASRQTCHIQKKDYRAAAKPPTAVGESFASRISLAFGQRSEYTPHQIDILARKTPTVLFFYHRTNLL